MQLLERYSQTQSALKKTAKSCAGAGDFNELLKVFESELTVLSEAAAGEFSEASASLGFKAGQFFGRAAALQALNFAIHDAVVLGRRNKAQETGQGKLGQEAGHELVDFWGRVLSTDCLLKDLLIEALKLDNKARLRARSNALVSSISSDLEFLLATLSHGYGASSTAALLDGARRALASCDAPPAAALQEHITGIA